MSITTTGAFSGCDTHRGITEYVEIHMTFNIHCKYNSKDNNYSSDINFILNPTSEKLLVLILKMKSFHRNAIIPLGLSNINNHWSTPLTYL